MLPKDLLLDIHSFYYDYAIVKNMYGNRHFLLHDLFDFIDNPHMDLPNTIYGLWGKLTPYNRTWFINKYVLENMDL